MLTAMPNHDHIQEIRDAVRTLCAQYGEDYCGELRLQSFGATEAEANMAKMLAAEASWKAGDTRLQTHGGFGMSREYHIERKLRETRLYQIAPISTNLIPSYINEHVPGMPRSF